MATQPATVPPMQVAYQPNFQGPPFHPPIQHQPTFNHIYRPPTYATPHQQAQAFRPQTTPPAPYVTCIFCGHKGHYESYCRKKEAAPLSMNLSYAVRQKRSLLQVKKRRNHPLVMEIGKCRR